MMKWLFSLMAILAVTTMISVFPVEAQDPATTNMDILAEKVKADKKLVVAMNMDLNDQESKGFWPLYDAYQADLAHVNQRVDRLISEYANSYNSGSISDETAAKLIKEWVETEAEEMKLRVDNIKLMAKVLPPPKVARYLQIENKIRALVKFGLAAQVPLVY